MPVSFPMIKSVKNGGEEKEESLHSWNCIPSHHGESFCFIPEILPDFLERKSHDFYDKISSSLIKDLSLSLRDKSLLPCQGSIFQEVRDLETRKSVDKYIFLYYI